MYIEGYKFVIFTEMLFWYLTYNPEYLNTSKLTQCS